MHNLEIPWWARYRMTQQGNPDVFWWMNSKQIQPILDGEPRELMGITEEEFKGYLDGMHGVKTIPVNIVLENK